MKNIKNLCLGLAVASVSVMSVSCGSTGTGLLNDLLTTGASVLTGTTADLNTSTSTRGQLLNVGATILTQLLQNGVAQKGTNQQYTGTYTGQLLVYNKSSKQYEYKGSQTTMKNATTTLTVAASSTGITMPAISAGNASMTQVSLTNLVATNGVYGLSDSSTVTEGKLTYNGTTYDLANAYVELQYSGTTSCTYSASIYFNYDESLQQYLLAMNVTFK